MDEYTSLSQSTTLVYLCSLVLMYIWVHTQIMCVYIHTQTQYVSRILQRLLYIIRRSRTHAHTCRYVILLGQSIRPTSPVDERRGRYSTERWYCCLSVCVCVGVFPPFTFLGVFLFDIFQSSYDKINHRMVSPRMQLWFLVFMCVCMNACAPPCRLTQYTSTHLHGRYRGMVSGRHVRATESVDAWRRNNPAFENSS